MCVRGEKAEESSVGCVRKLTKGGKIHGIQKKDLGIQETSNLQTGKLR